MVRYCTACGKALPEGSAANRRYCFSCAERIRLDDARERARRVRESKPKVEKPAPTPKVAPEKKLPLGRHRVKPKEKPKTNHDLLVDDNAAAAAKGMSYGKFKEWQRRQKELKERGEI